MSDNVIVEVNHVEKSFGLYRDDRINVLKGISLNIYEGEFVCIMGASGSGKTTLLNILSTIDQPTKGSCKIYGKNTGKMSHYELADFRYQHLGFVFQNFYLIQPLTVRENIGASLYVKNMSISERDKRVEAIAKTLGIDDLLNKPVGSCSRGQQQRVALARAMVTQPSILIADEPTGNLDHQNSTQLLEKLSKFHQQGMTIILVTHDIHVASFAHRVLYLEDGIIQKEFLRENQDRQTFRQQLKTTLYK